MSAEPNDEHASLRQTLNLSGFPFQLRVEKLLRALADRYGLKGIERDLPALDTFVDLVCRKDECQFVFECKRMKEETSWVFVVDNQGPPQNSTLCQLEYAEGLRLLRGEFIQLLRERELREAAERSWPSLSPVVQ